jgi:hypothetical protein
MAENRCSQGGSTLGGRETVCIDTYRSLDSSRDRDCYEDVRIYLTALGQEVIDNTCTVRVRSSEVVWTQISVDPIPFNCGFYQLTARYYVKLCFEGCVSTGRSQDFSGIAVLEKRAVLYGGEGSVKIFTSSSETGLCDFSPAEAASNLPVGVVEVVDPIALSVKICERDHQCGCCFCRCDEIPEAVSSSLIGPLVDPDCGNRLYVSLGIFSVIRLKRPAQLLVSGTDYCVPDKESVTAEQDDPCSLFRTMAFPTGEFAGTNCNQNGGSNRGAVLSTANGVGSSSGRCGCGNGR